MIVSDYWMSNMDVTGNFLEASTSYKILTIDRLN
jgi:hypothetical protein